MADKIYKWTDDPMLSGVKDCDTDVVNDCLMHLKYENTSDAIQNMYTTGQVETQTRGYNQLLSMKHSTFDKSKFTVVGSPTITDNGVASGFIDGRFEVPNLTSILPAGSTKFEIEIGFKTQPSFSGFQVIYSQGRTSSAISKGVALWCTGNGSFYFETGNGTNNNNNLLVGTLNTNTEYKIKIIAEDGNYKSYLSTEGGAYVLKNTVTITYPINGTLLSIGSQEGYYYFTGSIDLKHFSITVDGKEVFSGNKTGLDVIKPDNYEVVGSPVISEDGVASGFSDSNYITSSSILLKSTKWDIECLFKSDGIQTSNRIVEGTSSLLLIISASSNRLAWSFGSLVATRTTNYVVDNTYHILKLSYNSGTFNLYIDGSLIDTYSATIENNITTTIYFGKSPINANRFLNGSIDLNSFKIYVDGNLVYQPCLKIPYTESKTGSKIVDEVYRDRVIDLYEQEGQAGYYTIDEENKNFTLPMGEIYGMIEGKGTYQPPLLSTMWSDHLLNDMSWLRADTFSWQDGTTYSQAYNELLSEYNDSASVEETEGSITYKRTPKGYKIALATQETAILNKYTADGIAWYYILDTTNKKFKLPRTKFGFEGLRTSVGNDIEAYASLTVPCTSWGTTGIGFGTAESGRLVVGSGKKEIEETLESLSVAASDKTITSSNVQPPATQMYLYFYIDNFTKSAEAQTAGLNSELLNGKADVDTPSIQAPYLKTTYVNGTSGYRIWSDGYCEQWGDLALNATNLTFLKPFANTDYTFTIYIDSVNNQYAYVSSHYYLTSKTKTGITKNAGDLLHWKACGYIA